jgi:hypothetical protein
MTPVVDDVALAVGGSLAASIIAKVTATMALTLVAVRLARKSRAAVRHVLLAATFVVLMALPIASILIRSVPRVEVPIVAGWIARSPALPSLPGFTLWPLVWEPRNLRTPGKRQKALLKFL